MDDYTYRVLKHCANMEDNFFKAILKPYNGKLMISKEHIIDTINITFW